jgi:hypothetical protein
MLDGRPLTMRQFVCYLLGYLAFLCLFALIGAVAAQLIHNDVMSILSQHMALKLYVFKIGTFLIFLLLNYILITTLWALYFLTDVVNRPS